MTRGVGLAVEQRFDPAQARPGVRVRRKDLGRRATAGAGLQEHLEHAGQPRGAVAGPGHVSQAEGIGLALLVAAEQHITASPFCFIPRAA